VFPVKRAITLANQGRRLVTRVKLDILPLVLDLTTVLDVRQAILPTAPVNPCATFALRGPTVLDLLRAGVTLAARAVKPMALYAYPAAQVITETTRLFRALPVPPENSRVWWAPVFVGLVQRDSTLRSMVQLFVLSAT